MNACLQHKIYQAAVLLQLVSLQNNIILPSKTELCLMLKVTHTCFLFWLTFYSQIFSLLVSVDLLHCTAASNYYLLFSLLPPLSLVFYFLFLPTPSQTRSALEPLGLWLHYSVSIPIFWLAN